MSIDLSKYNVAEVPEPVAVEEGEYKIRIIDCPDVKEDKNGNPYIMPRFEVCDAPLAKDFSKYFGLPTSEMDPKQLNNTLLKLKRFGDAFGLDFSRPLQFDELSGLEAWAILGVEESEEYGQSNYIKKFIAGA